MSKTTEIILKDGRAFRRVVEETCLGWTDDLIEEYWGSNHCILNVFTVRLGPKAMLALSSLKVLLVGEIEGFDFSCHFSPVRVDDGEVFFIPTKSGGVQMTLPWRPPSDAICLAGYCFDLEKKYMDAAFVYLLPKEKPSDLREFRRLVRVPSLTNIWDTGLVCLGNNKPNLYDFPLWEFREDFVQRMSTVPWNNDLFPRPETNLAANRWNAQGEKEDYSLNSCCQVNSPDQLILEVVERYYRKFY